MELRDLRLRGEHCKKFSTRFSKGQCSLTLLWCLCISFWIVQLLLLITSTHRCIPPPLYSTSPTLLYLHKSPQLQLFIFCSGALPSACRAVSIDTINSPTSALLPPSVLHNPPFYPILSIAYSLVFFVFPVPTLLESWIQPLFWPPPNFSQPSMHSTPMLHTSPIHVIFFLPLLSHTLPIHFSTSILHSPTLPWPCSLFYTAPFEHNFLTSGHSYSPANHTLASYLSSLNHQAPTHLRLYHPLHTTCPQSTFQNLHQLRLSLFTSTNSFLVVHLAPHNFLAIAPALILLPHLHSIPIFSFTHVNIDYQHHLFP
jgi:hypothetical protein